MLINITEELQRLRLNVGISKYVLCLKTVPRRLHCSLFCVDLALLSAINNINNTNRRFFLYKNRKF